MNEKVIGICLIGDFTKHLPSDLQVLSAHRLCQYFINIGSVPNVKSWDDVVGHKELQATACPGTSWDKTQDGDMWWRIKTGTPYNPQGEEVENDQDKIARLENKIKSLKEQLTNKELELVEHAGKIQGLENSLDRQEADNKDLGEQILKKESERIAAIKEKEIAETKADSLEGRVTTLVESEKSLRTQLTASIRVKVKALGLFKVLKLYFLK